jgi:hypothetical protein
MVYRYNLSGALVELKYPSGRVVRNVLYAEGDLKTVKSQKNATQEIDTSLEADYSPPNEFGGG